MNRFAAAIAGAPESDTADPLKRLRSTAPHQVDEKISPRRTAITINIKPLLAIDVAKEQMKSEFSAFGSGADVSKQEPNPRPTEASR